MRCSNVKICIFNFSNLKYPFIHEKRTRWLWKYRKLILGSTFYFRPPSWDCLAVTFEVETNCRHFITTWEITFQQLVNTCNLKASVVQKLLMMNNTVKSSYIYKKCHHSCRDWAIPQNYKTWADTAFKTLFTCYSVLNRILLPFYFRQFTTSNNNQNITHTNINNKFTYRCGVTLTIRSNLSTMEFITDKIKLKEFYDTNTQSYTYRNTGLVC